MILNYAKAYRLFIIERGIKMSMKQVYEVFPKCPRCGDRRVGKVGAKQYFCSECSSEFKKMKDGALVIVDYYKEEKKKVK